MSERRRKKILALDTDSTAVEGGRELTRRTVIKGALAGVAIGSISGWGLYKRFAEKDPGTPEADNQPFPGGPEANITTPALAENEALEVGSPLGDAEALRQLAENEGEQALIDSFRISKEQAGTPSAFAETFARQVGRWITAGCTPEELAGHTAETLTDYQAEMRDKYGVAAATGLGGEAGLASSQDGTVQSTALFESISALHDQVLEHYMNIARSGYRGPTSFMAEVASPPQMGTPDPYNHRYPLQMELRFAVTNEEVEPIVSAGEFNVVLYTSGQNYEIELNDRQPIPLFEAEAA